VEALGLKAIQLKDAWATRRLLLARRSGGELSPAAALLMAHLSAPEAAVGSADDIAGARTK